MVGRTQHMLQDRVLLTLSVVKLLPSKSLTGMMNWDSCAVVLVVLTVPVSHSCHLETVKQADLPGLGATAQRANWPGKGSRHSYGYPFKRRSVAHKLQQASGFSIVLAKPQTSGPPQKLLIQGVWAGPESDQVGPR
jgi:hypothetical protein